MNKILPFRFARTRGIAQHYVFVELNSRNDFYLFRKWSYLTQEIAAKKNERPVGLSRGENHNYWRTVDWFKGIFYRALNCLIVAFSVVLNVGLFVVRFEEINFWLFLFIQVINCWHIPAFFYYFFHAIHSINVMYVEVIRVLSLKFNRIARRTAQLNVGRTKRINRKLFKLLFEHNRVHVELQEMNAFFSIFVSMNVIHLFR